jgi:hypothetical protein
MPGECRKIRYPTELAAKLVLLKTGSKRHERRPRGE